MMRNKIHLKRYLTVTAIAFLVLFVLLQVMNLYEYEAYNDNYNRLSAALVSKIREEYPNLSDGEIIKILNSTNYESSDSSLLNRYGIYPDRDAIIIKNDAVHRKYMLLKNALLIVMAVILLFIFLKYEFHREKEISTITRYIEQINRKNYTLDIDDMSEDELSILKNEIYKTTVMLKESAQNSQRDKLKLKKSLEDISHQLKTPLTSIMVILDNLIDDSDMDSDTRAEFIRDIYLLGISGAGIDADSQVEKPMRLQVKE